MDIYPTLTELAGLPTPKQVEGRSLRNFWITHYPMEWNRNYQVLRPADDRLKDPVMGRSIRTERWRYSDWGEGKYGEELYDHFADPMEFKNLALNPTKEKPRNYKDAKKELTEKAVVRYPQLHSTQKGQMEIYGCPYCWCEIFLEDQKSYLLRLEQGTEKISSFFVENGRYSRMK